MGSNAATTLNTAAKLAFGDTMIEAGEYRLTAKRVSESDWHLVITNDDGAVEVPLKTGTATSSVETFKITLASNGSDSGTFTMEWGTLKAGTDFKVK